LSAIEWCHNINSIREGIPELHMAHVILVHGIDNQLEVARTIERDWLPALAGSVEHAGFADIAERLSPREACPNPFEVRSAWYGGLFRPAGALQAQGPDASPLMEEEIDFFEPLAIEWLRRAEYSESEEQRKAAEMELADLGLKPTGQAESIRSATRWSVAHLCRIPWFGQLGARAVEVIIPTLRQVRTYLGDEDVRAKAKKAVLDLVDEKTRVIVAHSLGSVVAYEACFSLTRSLPLLVTIGSPLGLRGIVYDRLQPRPPVFPPLVKRWMNIADRNDIVAAEPDLGHFFGTVPDGAVFDSAGRVFNGRKAHKAESYLTDPLIGTAIGETLRG
jgi:hypothetical protein